MTKPRTLIFVGAHPDDETFGIGGTLAQYAAAGVKTYYACGTRGEVGVADPEHMKGYATVGDMRWAELTCAAKFLGLTDIIHLGYRDSGMPGTEDNKHPNALAAACLEEVAGRIVKIFRELKPEVVVTFDPIGGYNHPDHIAIHKATVKAFAAAGDPQQYPEAGSAFAPQKLYFGVHSHGMLKLWVKLMPLFGQDPHHLGKNKDIDITLFANASYPVHAVIKLSPQSIEARDKATDCHASQLGGGGPPGGWLQGLVEKARGQRDFFMRAYPPVKGRMKKERDLFEGVK